LKNDDSPYQKAGNHFDHIRYQKTISKTYRK